MAEQRHEEIAKGAQGGACKISSTEWRHDGLQFLEGDGRRIRDRSNFGGEPADNAFTPSETAHLLVCKALRDRTWNVTTAWLSSR